MAAAEIWVWTETGLACLPDGEAFGDPEPGDPFTEEHHRLVQDDLTGESDLEVLQGMGFIEKKAAPPGSAAAAGPSSPAEEEPAGASSPAAEEVPAETPAARPEAPKMKQLWEMTDEEFEQVPKVTPPHERPRFRNRKVHREAAAMDLPGRHFGLVFPYTCEKLQEAGPEWLTKALHAAGTLPLDNRVVKMQVIPLSLDPLAGEALGGSSIKCRVEVAYEYEQEGLHTKMFGKMPLEPTDTSERFEHHKWFIDEPEVMYNRLLAESCPFRVPKTYFTDHCPASTNFIHLSEWIEYSDEYEPKRAFQVAKANLKCRDYDLPKMGVERYIAFFRSLARLCAAYWSGKLGDHARLGQVFENVWPTLDPGYSSGWPLSAEDRAAAAESLKSQEVRQHVLKRSEMSCNLSIVQMATGVDFVLNIAPQLFGKEVRQGSFLLKMMKDHAHVMQHNWEIDAFMTQYPEQQCLFHPNVQLDNACYYYVDEGCTKMDAAIFDWSGAKCMPFIDSMASNMQSGAEPEMLDEHEEGIIRAWVDEYHEAGGSQRLTFPLVYTCFKLAQCKAMASSLGFIVNLLKDAPRTHPVWKQVQSRRDPEIADFYVRRALVGQIDHALEAWRSKKRNNYGVFLKWAEENRDIVFKRPPLEHEITLPKPRSK